MSKSIKRGDTLELVIKDLAFGARGLARLDGFVWFVESGIPGQKVIAKVKRVQESYGEACVYEVLESSPHQVDPPCHYFGTCGGCQLQHLQYEVQVDAKTRQVQEILERIGGLNNTVIRPTLPAENIYNYRNKMEFSFSDQRWINKDDPHEASNDFALGLHVQNCFNKVLDIEACMLQSERSNSILKDVRELIRQTEMRPYSTKTHTGFWRFLVIREGKNTGDSMLNFVTSSQESEKGRKTIDWIVHKLFWRQPELTSVIHGITDRKAQTTFSESERLILGPKKITEKIDECIFEVSPNAFFQTNTDQAKRLFETITELADFQGEEIVYDLYCGTGAIGISIADKVKQVLGIEVIESAIEDGRRNVGLNEITNVQFVPADMKDALEETDALTQKYGSPDVVILDPPRGGTHPKTVKHLLELSPQKIIYVSCNPPILARDVKVLCENVYALKVVQPVDMFPHTGHIEVVALLVRRS